MLFNDLHPEKALDPNVFNWLESAKVTAESLSHPINDEFISVIFAGICMLVSGVVANTISLSFVIPVPSVTLLSPLSQNAFAPMSVTESGRDMLSSSLQA